MSCTVPFGHTLDGGAQISGPETVDLKAAGSAGTERRVCSLPLAKSATQRLHAATQPTQTDSGLNELLLSLSKSYP